MQKSYLLLQLIDKGSAVWQVRQEVPEEHCRKMTTPELDDIGHGMADVLAGIVLPDPRPVRPHNYTSAEMPTPKKKR